MTGARHGTCDCCGVDDCGFSSTPATPCGTVSSSECPETLVLTFSYAGSDFYQDCNYGVGSTDCQITNPVPAISSTAITVTQVAGNRCRYEGSTSISGSWATNPCTGSAVTNTWDRIDVVLWGYAQFLTSAQLASACTGQGCTGTKCAGICASIDLHYTYPSGGTGVYRLAACWFSHCIPNCSTDVPCYNSYANSTPNQTNTWLNDCTGNPTDASACISGDGWSTTCGGNAYATESEPSFTAAIS